MFGGFNISSYICGHEFSGFQIWVMTMKSLSKEEWIKKCKQLLDHKKEMEERFKANADTDIYALYGKA